MSGPRFSVILPLYNKAPHVAASINSVLAQSLSPHDLIIIDDCFSDGGRDIAAAVRDPRIRLFERKSPGPGGYAATHLGIRQASGGSAEHTSTPQPLMLNSYGVYCWINKHNTN